jgi:predicted small lipoprotein YifL
LSFASVDMHCWARYLLYAIVSVLAIGQMGVACGQKGPLYLPESTERSESAAVAAPATSADDGSPEMITDDIPAAGPQPGEEIPTPSGE